MRFPLDHKEIHGYQWGDTTWYNDHHLGTDWKADFVPLYAPCDGKIVYVGEGPQAGKAIHFVPKGQEPFIIRWLHLSKWLVSTGQSVTEGQQIAITGQSGSSAQASFPHLHEDMWPAGHVDPFTFKLTINPEEYWSKFMSNVMFVHKAGTGEYGFYVPAMSQDALKDKAKNFGLMVEKPDGTIDFSKAKDIQGL